MTRYRVARSDTLWGVWRDEDGQSRPCGYYERDRAILEARLRARYENAVAAELGRLHRTEVVIAGE